MPNTHTHRTAVFYLISIIVAHLKHFIHMHTITIIIITIEFALPLNGHSNGRCIREWLEFCCCYNLYCYYYASKQRNTYVLTTTHNNNKNNTLYTCIHMLALANQSTNGRVPCIDIYNIITIIILVILRRDTNRIDKHHCICRCFRHHRHMNCIFFCMLESIDNTIDHWLLLLFIIMYITYWKSW